MAELADILNSLQKVETNPNDNSFIELMQDISGNPSDGIAPENDEDSIYGAIVKMYNEMVEARDEEITEAIAKIVGLTASAESVAPGTSASAELVGSDIQIKVPIGVPGANGVDGMTPQYAIRYEAPNLVLELTGHIPSTDVPTEEW